MPKFDWQHDQTIRDFVRYRWAEGKSARQIAKEWNGSTEMTRNDVIGAVHRYGLGESRPSPIRNAKAPTAWTTEQVAVLVAHPNGNLDWLAGKTAHSLGAVKTKIHALRVSGVITTPRTGFVPAVATHRPPPPPKPVIVAPPPVAVVKAPSRTGLLCQWLNGFGSPDWDQCTANATHGRSESSWCDRHRARVFVRRGIKTEAA